MRLYYGRISKAYWGEFWFELNMISSEINNFKENDERIYLDGGQNEIKFIIENMEVREEIHSFALKDMESLVDNLLFYI